MSLTPSGRFRVPPAVHTRRFGAELVVLDLTGGEYFALDEMGARIWDELANDRPTRDVVSVLAHEYQVDSDRLWSDLERFLDELVAKGLLLAV
jgi:hypothetical protein